MRRGTLTIGTSVLLSLVCCASLPAADPPEPEFTRTERVIYGEKLGMALVMDVFQPKENARGRGIVFVVSGGWFSGRQAITPMLPKEYLRRGYTVFAVVHGTQPKFAMPEIVEDMHRAVRFIRTHAKDYNIDPDKIGITGASAGGHLSLMQGTAGKAGDPDAADSVDRASSRVQAVACFFPPTDFLNYGEPGHESLGGGKLSAFAAPFDFQEFDQQTHRFERIVDPERRRKIGRDISPISHVTGDDPPVLIVHGDADKLVPIQQAEIIVAKLKEAGVPAKLVAKAGAGHGWADWAQDLATLADWFDEHLK